MGRSMCEHLLRAGHKITVFNRTPSKLQSLIDLGATPASTTREVAENSDIVFSIVGFPRDVQEIMLGDDGIFRFQIKRF